MSNIKNAGLVCCSNGQLERYKNDIDSLDFKLRNFGITPVYSDYIYAKDYIGAGTAQERARALMDFYIDDSVDAIFDISGGDIANEILAYLDYDVIAATDKKFYGYSDLTTVINALYTMTGKSSVLYQVKNLVWDSSGLQEKVFLAQEMYNFRYEFVQGNSMSGVVVGGNIRCLLKLAGTKYLPDMNGKILFLEALSGGEAQLRTYFAQLSDLSVFNEIDGILLGTFIEFQKNNSMDKLITIVKDYAGCNLPIAITDDVGHSNLSKALNIGQVYVLN